MAVATQEFSIIRQLFQLLRRINIQPWYFGVPVLLAIAAASLEGASIGLLIPMLTGFLSKDYSFIQDIPGLRWLVQLVTGSEPMRDRTLFIVLICVFVVVTLLKNILRFGATISMSFLAQRAGHHLRKQIFNRYLSFGKLYFDQTNIGQHATTLSQFTSQALGPVMMIDKFMQALFSLMAYFVVMWLISWKVTAIAIPLFLILHFAVRVMVLRIQQLSKSIAANTIALGQKVIEILSVIPLVKAYNTEDLERTHYTQISDQAARLEFRKVVFQNLIRPLQETITLFAILLLFSIMLYILVREGQTAATSFLVYFYVIVNATNKFGVLTSFRGDLVNAHGAVEKVMSVFDDDDKFVVSEGRQTFPGLKKHIHFQNLHFSYDDKEVLKGISFRVHKGELTALVGPTGAGKTTVINLILRFYDCSESSLLMDDTDIHDFSAESLRSHMALVSQETLLLHDTLRNNITYGQGEVSEKELQSIIRRARLEEYVEGLPQGLDTLIGDRGVKLSGGEKQRVSIARALLKGADILILDEATSALDSKTEMLIQDAIDDAIKGKTAIVIAHRLSTIKHADRIVVLEKGKCVEEGTLEELLKKKDRFYAYWEAQKFS